MSRLGRIHFAISAVPLVRREISKPCWIPFPPSRVAGAVVFPTRPPPCVGRSLFGDRHHGCRDIIFRITLPQRLARRLPRPRPYDQKTRPYRLRVLQVREPKSRQDRRNPCARLAVVRE